MEIHDNLYLKVMGFCLNKLNNECLILYLVVMRKNLQSLLIEVIFLFHESSVHFYILFLCLAKIETAWQEPVIVNIFNYGNLIKVF